MLFAELVSHAVSILQMVRVCCLRDWRTQAAHDDPPQATSGNNLQIGQQTSQPSFSGKRNLSAEARRAQAEARIPRIPAVSSQGTTTHSLCALNQDARHKAEDEPVGFGPPMLTLYRSSRRKSGTRNDLASRTGLKLQAQIRPAACLDSDLPRNERYIQSLN